MSEVIKEWGAATVSFFLSFAIVTGVITPNEIEDCETTVAVTQSK